MKNRFNSNIANIAYSANMGNTTSTTSSTVSLLDDSFLDQVLGGNKGDYDKDTKDYPRYRVGQQVEVIVGHCFWHTLTKRKTIVAVQMFNGHWKYQIKNDYGNNFIEWEWITADKIES